MKQLHILILALTLSFGLYGQQDITNRVNFSISYFGILGTHPGIKVGVQYPLTNSVEIPVDRLDQIVAGSNLMIYFHRNNQLGIGLDAELGFRSRRRGGVNYELFFGGGYLRTFLPRKMYDFDEPDGFRLRRFKGSGHFLKKVGFGLGAQSGRDLDSNFWSIRPTFLHIKPFNTSFTYNFAIDAGISFYP